MNYIVKPDQETYKILGCSETSLRADVEALKQWMHTQKHLPEILDDKALENFLILTKCSVEIAKKRIDAYYTMRSEIPDLFENFHPALPHMRECSEILCWVGLPKLTKEKYRVFVNKIRPGKSYDNIDPLSAFKIALNIQEVRLHEDLMLGDVIIWDFHQVTFNFITKLTPTLIWKILTVYKQIYSIRMKALYLVNSPAFVAVIMSILKRILSAKLYNRVFVCEDTSILKEKLGVEILPIEYGGEEKSVEELQELWNLKYQEYDERFKALENLKVDEKLRPAKLENDSTLGFYGNFKKIEVD